MRNLMALLAIAMVAPSAQADYAVLRSGQRLHISGYVREGENVRLNVEGGSVVVAADDLLRIEPEEVFTAAPASASATPGPYGSIIQAEAAAQGLDPKLVSSVIAAESNFNPRAVSRRQALGLMQLRPETAARYSASNAFDPAQNIAAGTHYLKDLLEQYHGNLALALAAYNAGPNRVQKYGGVPPYPETRSYVRRVTKKLAEHKRNKAPEAPR